MRRAAYYAVTVCLILLGRSFASADPGALHLVTPNDRTLVKGEILSVVAKLSGGGADALVISVNGREVARVPVTQGQEFYCKTVKLNVGPNVVSANAYRNGAGVLSESVAVFYRSDISKAFSSNPAEYRKSPFHHQESDRTCVPCHRMEPSDTDVSPASPSESGCNQCHKAVTAYAHVHGPSATWSCLSCHERDSRPLKYATAEPERDSCFACHVEEKNEWESRKYVHGPTAMGACTICHNPHASDNPYWLRKPVWDLCISCHERMTTHSIRPFGLVNKNHPTRDRPDPTKPGKMLTCASCHTPHAADTAVLFGFNSADSFTLCMNCHVK